MRRSLCNATQTLHSWMQLSHGCMTWRHGWALYRGGGERRDGKGRGETGGEGEGRGGRGEEGGGEEREGREGGEGEVSQYYSHSESTYPCQYAWSPLAFPKHCTAIEYTAVITHDNHVTRQTYGRT